MRGVTELAKITLAQTVSAENFPPITPFWLRQWGLMRALREYYIVAAQLVVYR